MTDVYLVILLLVVTAGGLALFPFLTPVSRLTTTASAVDPIEKWRGQLSDLLNDYQMGKMSEADYEELKTKLESRLKAQKTPPAEQKPPKGGRKA